MTLRLTESLGSVDWDSGQKSEFVSYFTNLVTHREGNTAAIVLDSAGSERDRDGTSSGLSNQLDRSFLVALRNQSTVVVTTGATIRAEGVHFPAHGRLAVLTRNPALDVPKVSGSGTIQQVTWDDEFRPPAASVTCDGIQLQIAPEPLALEPLLRTEKLHLEAGLTTLLRLWNASFIHQLWLTHPVGLDAKTLFPSAELAEWLQLGPLTLSLLKPKSAAASL